MFSALAIFLVAFVLQRTGSISVTNAQDVAQENIQTTTIENEGDTVVVEDTALANTFENLEDGFEKITLELESDSHEITNTQEIMYSEIVAADTLGESTYVLDSGVEIITEYTQKGSASPTLGKSVKQLISLRNPTTNRITLDLNLYHQIDAEAFIWDGTEYQITEEGQEFSAYEGTVDIDLNETLGASEFTEKELPTLTNIPALKGTTISFKTQEGNIATYDFSDLAQLDHTVIVKKEAGQAILTLRLTNIAVEANATTILDPTYSLATSSYYNSKYYGENGATFSYSGLSQFGDLNNNGKPDIVIGSGTADNGGTNTGSVYVIFDTLLDDYTGTGNDIDMADSNSYSLRFDGAVAEDRIGRWTNRIEDVNGDGKNDLLIGSQLTDFNGSSSGSLYVIYNNLLNSYGSKNISLATATNFNLRYDGEAANASLLGGSNVIRTKDINNNGTPDLIIGSANSDFGGANTGSLYIIFDSLIDNYSGTGNTINLGEQDGSDYVNFNIRYDGQTLGDGFGNGLEVADMDGDGKYDLVVGAKNSDYTGGASGSVYIIYNTLVDDYTTVGNVVPLSTTSNFNIRYDGQAAGDNLGYGSLAVGDINANGELDLVLGADLADNNGGSSGSVYIIYDTLIDDYSGTGNTVSLASTSNYNTRINGQAAGDGLAFVSLLTGDFNNDQKDDILVHSVANNGFTDSGSVYIIYNATLNSYSTQSVNLSSTDTYDVRYDGAAASNFLGYHSIYLHDLNSDGSKDLLMGAVLSDDVGRTDSGSLYIIYNFPHSFSLTGPSGAITHSIVNITGNIVATQSTTTINGAQFQVDSNDPNGTWTSCSAVDGSFNSTTEGISCTTPSLSHGWHTMYVRAVDSNNSYTARSSYSTFNFEVRGSTESVGAEPRPDLTSERGDIVSEEGVVTVVPAQTFSFDVYLTVTQMLKGVPTVISNKNITGQICRNQIPFFQVSPVYEIYYSSFFNDAKILSVLYAQPIILAIPYQTQDLLITGLPGKSFNQKNLKIAFSTDKKTWKILPRSVVDLANKTVSVLDKPNGFYMLVASWFGGC